MAIFNSYVRLCLFIRGWIVEPSKQGFTCDSRCYFFSGNSPIGKATISGWWFGTWIWWLSIYWEFHHPNWRTPSFFRGVVWNHQPDFKMPTMRVQRFHMGFSLKCHHGKLGDFLRLKPRGAPYGVLGATLWFAMDMIGFKYYLNEFQFSGNKEMNDLTSFFGKNENLIPVTIPK